MDCNLQRLFMKNKDPMESEEYMKSWMLFQDSLDDWKKNKMKQLFSKSYNARRMGDQWSEIKDYEDELEQTVREATARKHNNLYLWLTVSPKASIEWKDFKDVIERFVKRTMFNDHLYVYEQRGKEETSIGDGFHCHLLLKRNLDYKPSKVIQNSKNTFKNITNVKKFEIFNYHWLDEQFKKDKVEYITGLKTGEDKDVKQEMDILFRKYNDIDLYYGNLEI